MADEKEKSPLQDRTKDRAGAAPVSVDEIGLFLPPKVGPLLPDGLAVKLFAGVKEMTGENALRPIKITRSKQDITAAQAHLKRLEVIREMLAGAAELTALRQRVKERKELVAQVYQQNMEAIFLKQRPLEKTYRELDTLFTEARINPGEDVAYISVVNASADRNFAELMDPETGLAAVQKHNRENFDMRELKGLLVIPEWVGSEAKLVKYGEIAQLWMGHLFAGFPDVDLKEAQRMFEVGEIFADLKSADVVKQSISVAANPLRLRLANRYEKGVGDFYVSPAGVLAGKVYRGDVTDGIHVARANVQFGKVALPTADGSELKPKWEIVGGQQMKFNKAIIPLVYNQGIVFWGVDTLFLAGDPAHAGMDQYSVKRCDEYIAKVVLHYLNSRTFIPNETKARDGMFSALSRFLMHNTGGEGKMLNEGKVLAVETVRNPDGTENPQAVDVRIFVKYKNAIRQLNLYLVSNDEHQWKEGAK